MICPSCESKTQRCQETRTFHDPSKGFFYTERRRKCADCGHLYKTIEVPMEVWAQEANND